MKGAFSTAWKSSTQRRKQRKYAHNIPMHGRTKFLNAHLSESLRQKHGVRAVGLRVGDKVRVMRGTHKGKEGKIERVDTKNYKVFVQKIEHVKREGGNSPYPLAPSNLLVVDLQNEKRRFAATKAENKKTATPAPAKQPAKPASATLAKSPKKSVSENK